jgi:hypothetical protein
VGGCQRRRENASARRSKTTSRLRAVRYAGSAGGTLTLLALLEPIALAVHLQDVDVVREPVEQRAGEPLGGKDAGPFVKRQIAGHQGLDKWCWPNPEPRG